MPLKEGHNREAITWNIRELIHAGYSRKQSIAIAYAKARESKKKERDKR